MVLAIIVSLYRNIGVYDDIQHDLTTNATRLYTQYVHTLYPTNISRDEWRNVYYQ